MVSVHCFASKCWKKFGREKIWWNGWKWFENNSLCFSVLLPTCTNPPPTCALRHQLVDSTTIDFNQWQTGSRKSSAMKNTHMRGHGKFRHGNVQSGTQLRMDSGSTPEEEFFCLTPEDSRSIISTASGGSSRSRNASSTSTTSAVVGRKSIDMKSIETLHLVSVTEHYA